MSIAHDDLATKLARHLLVESRMVYEDIPVGRSGSVRPDVLTIEKSYSNPNPTAYEIKVSVSDFRSDTTSGKWMGYLDFAWSVTFVVPRGLVKKSDIPDKCGLITYNEELGTFITVKRPTVNPQQLDTEMLLKLLIEGNKRQTKPEVIEPRKADQWHLNEKMRKIFGDKFSHKVSWLERDYPKHRKDYLDIRKELSEFFSVEKDDYNFFSSCRYAMKKMKGQCDKDARIENFMKSAEKFKDDLNNSIDRQITFLRRDIS